MVEGRFRITNELGLHARYATIIVKKANEFVSKIIIQCKNVETDLKSIMGVMSLAVSYNEIIKHNPSGVKWNRSCRLPSGSHGHHNLSCCSGSRYGYSPADSTLSCAH